MRKLLRTLVIGATLCLASLTTFASSDITLVVNGKTVQSSTKPIIKNGSTLVPVRVVSEAFGLGVEYRKESNEVWVRNKINRGIALVKNASKYIINGTTYLPLRNVGEQLLCETIHWDSKTKTVTLERSETFRHNVGYKGMFNMEINKDTDDYNPMYLFTRKDGTFDKDAFYEKLRYVVNFKTRASYIIDQDGSDFGGKGAMVAQIFLGIPSEKAESTARIVKLLSDPKSNINFPEETIKRAMQIAYDNDGSTDPLIESGRESWDPYMVHPGKLLSNDGKYSLCIFGGREQPQGTIMLVKN